jgi:hypothetical protein
LVLRVEVFDLGLTKDAGIVLDVMLGAEIIQKGEDVGSLHPRVAGW